MQKERVILGEDCIYSFDPKETGLNRNVAVVGGPGSGKTVSFGEAELIETLRSEDPVNRLFVVTKSRIERKYAPVFKEKGFHVYRVDFGDPERGDYAFDPLKYVRNEEDILDLARSIVMANERKEHSTVDPYWDEASVALLSAEIALVRMIKGNPTFSDVLDIHFHLEITEDGSGISTSLDSVFNETRKKSPDCFAVNQWRTFCEAAARTARSIYVVMNPTLMVFTKNIRQSMRTKPSIDFEKVANEKSIIFLTTSPVNKELHSLANIFVARAIAEFHRVAAMQTSGTLVIPVHITFDDFATGAKIAGMPEKMAITREMGISFSLLLQSESQLKKMYGDFGCTEILDCCDSYIYFGGNNYDTAKTISLKLDVPLTEILNMPVGEEVVFRRGQRGIMTKRYNIMKDPLYQKITEKYEKWLQDQERSKGSADYIERMRSV